MSRRVVKYIDYKNHSDTIDTKYRRNYMDGYPSDDISAGIDPRYVHPRTRFVGMGRYTDRVLEKHLPYMCVAEGMYNGWIIKNLRGKWAQSRHFALGKTVTYFELKEDLTLFTLFHNDKIQYGAAFESKI